MSNVSQSLRQGLAAYAALPADLRDEIQAVHDEREEARREAEADPIARAVRLSDEIVNLAQTSGYPPPRGDFAAYAAKLTQALEPARRATDGSDPGSDDEATRGGLRHG